MTRSSADTVIHRHRPSRFLRKISLALTAALVSLAGTASAQTPVVWTNVTGATASGNDLTKTATAAWGNAGAVSAAQLLFGNGGVVVTASETTTYRMFGLSNGSATTSWEEIDFGVLLTASGTLMVIENGTVIGTFGTYATGDLLEVSVTGGAVQYLSNAVTFYTSLTAPTYPLLVDTALYSTGATLLGAGVGGTWTSPTPTPTATPPVGVPVVWSSLVGATAVGNDLTKTATALWGNGGAVSGQQLLSGNGGVLVAASESTTYRMFGLSNGSANASWEEIDFALLLTSTGTLQVTENGVFLGTFGTYVTGDQLDVSVVGGLVLYRKNGVTLHTSINAPIYPLIIDTALYTQGSTLLDAVVLGTWTAAPTPTPTPTPTAGPASVIWTNIVGLGTSGLGGVDLTKTAATGWANGGASSSEKLLAGDGAVTITASETTTFRLFGLSNGDTDANWTDIDFALYLFGDRIFVFEGGVYRADAGLFATGDLLEVAVQSGTVQYKRNGTPFYFNTAGPTYPLVVDTAFYHQGSTLTGAVISGAWGTPTPTPNPAPTAVADNFGVSLGATSSSDNVLANDYLGVPSAPVTTFGGGSLGGSVNDNAAGAAVVIPASGAITVSVATDGTLIVNATAGTAIAGTYTLDYQIDNGIGPSVAAVAIVVQQGPIAQDDAFILLVAASLNGDLTASNGNGADTPGVPAYGQLTFGGGSLGGTVTSNSAGASVALAGGTLSVSLNGTVSLTNPTSTGTFTFQYRLSNTIPASDDATVTITIRQAPVAVADGTYSLASGATLTITTAAANDLLDNDTLGVPAGTLVNFGGGSLVGSTLVTDYAAGATSGPGTFGGGTLTVNVDGGFTVSAPTTPGTYTFLYRVQNVAGFDDATVTIQVEQAPVAQDDTFEMLLSATLNGNLTANNGSGADTPGAPPFNQLTFGGGSLAGTVTSNVAPGSVALAGGTLTINLDGTFSLVNPTSAGTFTLQYRLSNTLPASDDATVTITVQQVPVAVDDGPYAMLPGGTLTISTTDPYDLLDNDSLGFPAASLTSFGGGSLGGTVTTNAAGASVPLAGGSLTVVGDGSFSLVTPTTPGLYTFSYRLQSPVGFDDAVVTIEVQQAPIARDDTQVMLVAATLSGNLTADNGGGADTPGVPPFNQLTFGGGSLAGTVTSNVAPASVALAGGTLTVNADGTLTLANPTTTGPVTFQYRLSSAMPAFDDATVTITVREVPAITSANNVTFTVGQAGTFTVTTTGFPIPSIARGGVALPGGAPAVTFTDNGNGTGTLAGTPSAGTGGTYAISFMATNVAGSSSAQSFTLTVNEPPTAADDAYTTNANVAVSRAASASDDLLDNDTRGFPSADIASFGGGSLGGDVAAHAAGTTVNPLPSFGSGSLTVGANGSFSFTPPTGYSGTYTFQYRLSSTTGSDDATVTITVRPVAVGDAYTTTFGNVVGNVQIDTASSTAFSVRTNDVGLNLSASLVSATSAQGGTVSMNTNGTFVYDPPRGYEGADSFQYNVFGDGGTSASPATVTLNVAGMIWFVNNAGGTGDGRFSAPYNTVAAFQGVNNGTGANPATGDSIFLYENATAYTGPLTLLNNQRLIGQDATSSLATLSGLTFPVHSTLPATNGATGTGARIGGSGIVLGQGNSVYGLSLVNTSGTALGSPSNVGTFTMADVTINNAGSVGSGLSVTGGGTVTATGANTIETGTGTALNVSATTLGAAGFTFQRISAGGVSSGPSNGIVLNNTGVDAGLTVTGTGAAVAGGNGSGGLIRNTGSHGIVLTNTRAVSLANLTIQNTGDSGIHGTGVTNFSFVRGTIAGSGNGGAESNVAFNASPAGDNIAGTLVITDSVLTTAYFSGIDVQSGAGTVTSADLSRNTITSATSAAASRGNGINLVGVGSFSAAFTLNGATIAGNVISNFPSGGGVQVSVGNSSSTGPRGTAGIPGSGTDVVSITGNIIRGQSAGNRMNTSAILVATSGGNPSQRSRANVVVSGNGTLANPLAHTAGTTVGIGNNGYSDMVGVVSNNVIVSDNSMGANGIGGGNGVVVANETPSLNLTVTGNTISQTDGNGILLVGRRTAGFAAFKVQGNVVAAPLGGVRPGIRVDAGNAYSMDDAVCLNIANNVSAGSGGSPGIGLRKNGTTTTANDFGVNGMAATGTPAVEAFINGINPSGSGTLLISATSGFGACSLP